MKYVAPATLLATLLATFAFLYTVIAIPPFVIPQKPASQAVVKGQRLFNQTCAACHDTLGTTTKPGPGLRSYYHHEPRPADAAVRTIIQQGKGRMPAFSTLSRSQTDDLVAYLKTL